MSGTRKATFRVKPPIDVSQEESLATIGSKLTGVENGLGVKADSSYWTQQSAGKLLKTALDSALALKADKSVFDTAMTSKIAQTAFNTAIALKQDATAFASAMANKLDQSVWDARMGEEKKWFTAFKEGIVLDGDVAGQEFDYVGKELADATVHIEVQGVVKKSETEYIISFKTLPSYKLLPYSTTSFALYIGSSEDPSKYTVLRNQFNTSYQLKASDIGKNDSVTEVLVNDYHYWFPDDTIVGTHKIYVYSPGGLVPLSEPFTMPSA